MRVSSYGPVSGGFLHVDQGVVSLTVCDAGAEVDVHRVDRGIERDEVGRIGAADHLVVARTRPEVVEARAANQPVVAGSTDQRGVIEPGVEMIAPTVSAERMGPPFAKDRVVATQADDDNVSRGTDDHVVAGRAHDRRLIAQEACELECRSGPQARRCWRTGSPALSAGTQRLKRLELDRPAGHDGPPSSMVMPATAARTRTSVESALDSGQWRDRRISEELVTRIVVGARRRLSTIDPMALGGSWEDGAVRQPPDAVTNGLGGHERIELPAMDERRNVRVVWL